MSYDDVRRALCAWLPEDAMTSLDLKLESAQEFGVGPYDAACQWIDDERETLRSELRSGYCGDDDMALERFDAWAESMLDILRAARRRSFATD